MTERIVQPLSGKLQNRIKTELQRSQITVVGGVEHAKKLQHALTVRTTLEQGIPVLQEHRDGFNERFPKAVRAFTAEAYMSGIGGHDAHHFLPALADLTAEGLQGRRDSESTAFRVVFGASNAMPVRSLSYLLPALHTMDELRQSSIAVPQLQVVFATHIGAALNATVSETEAHQEAEQFVHIARDYINRFFPQLSSAVVFLEDMPFAERSAYRRHVQQLAETVSEQTHPLLIKARGKGENNHGSSQSDYYAAAHVFMHDTAAESFLQQIEEKGVAVKPILPRTIISIGGKQEELFYGLRFEVLRDLLGEGEKVDQTVQLFTRHHVPPYYHARGGDRSFGEQAGVVDRAASYDLEYLARATAARGGNIEAFLQEVAA